MKVAISPSCRLYMPVLVCPPLKDAPHDLKEKTNEGLTHSTHERLTDELATLKIHCPENPDSHI